MKDNKEILPIGSIVLLKKGKKKLSVSGYMPVMKKENRVYDYCGILYPEGMIDDEIFFFNHSDIKVLVLVRMLVRWMFGLEMQKKHITI